MSRWLCMVMAADGSTIHSGYFRAMDREGAREAAGKAWKMWPGFISVRYISSEWS